MKLISSFSCTAWFYFGAFRGFRFLDGPPPLLLLLLWCCVMLCMHERNFAQLDLYLTELYGETECLLIEVKLHKEFHCGRSIIHKSLSIH